jgi:hypothetical protein
MRSSNWILAALAVGAGVALLIVLDLIEDPDSSFGDMLLNLFEELPLVLVTVAAVLLYQLARRRREESRDRRGSRGRKVSGSTVARASANTPRRPGGGDRRPVCGVAAVGGGA